MGGSAASAPKEEFYSGLTVRGFSNVDIFRQLQDLFLERHGPLVEGDVIEIGGETHYDHQRFFTRASSFSTTNVARDHERYLDVTDIDLPDGSQDAYLCTSVLEHVDDIQKAVSEMARTLRPGGVLIATLPFIYPLHDEHDVWRIAPDGWDVLLGEDFELEVLARLGGRVSTIAMLLQRPVGNWRRRRFIPHKLFGIVWVALMGRRDQIDASPIGYGVVARRRTAAVTVGQDPTSSST